MKNEKNLFIFLKFYTFFSVLTLYKLRYWLWGKSSQINNGRYYINYYYFLFNVDFFFSKGQNAKLLIKHILKIKYVSYLEYMKKKKTDNFKEPVTV